MKKILDATDIKAIGDAWAAHGETYTPFTPELLESHEALRAERDEALSRVAGLVELARNEVALTRKAQAERDALQQQIDAMHRRGLGDVDGPELRARAERAEKERDGFRDNAKLYFEVLERHGIAWRGTVSLADDGGTT